MLKICGILRRPIKNLRLRSVIMVVLAFMMQLYTHGAFANTDAFNRMLFAPHPFAQQAVVNWNNTTGKPVLRTAPVVSTQSVPGAQVPYGNPDQPTGKQTSRNITHGNSDAGGVWSIQIGNEDRGFLTSIFEPVFDPVFGGSPTEGGLTWGWRIGYAPNKPNPDWFKLARPYLPWISSSAPVRVAYAVEQDAMTPSETAKNAGRTVRPYAGYLVFNTRIAIKQEKSRRWQRIDTLDMAIGLIGPASGAKSVHGVLPGHDNSSWDGIKSEPMVNFGYEYGHRFFVFEPDGSENIEIHPYVGTAVGNALTYGSMGINLRFGRNLFRDLGAPRQRVLLSGENFVETGNYWAWNLFMGLEGRAIAYNVFLDGNLLQSSKSVDSKPFVYDFQMGIEAGYGAYRFSVMNVYRSREFDGQQYSTEFIRVGMSAAF